MKYVVYHKTMKKFLLNAKDKWKDTKEEASKFRTLEIAQRFARTSRLDFDSLEFIPYDTSCTETKANEVLTKFIDLIEVKKDIEPTISYFTNIVNREEQIAQDLLHKLENDELTADEYIWIGHKLKTSRQIRRNAKNAIYNLQQITGALAAYNAPPKEYAPRQLQDLSKKRVYATQKN